MFFPRVIIVHVLNQTTKVASLKMTFKAFICCSRDAWCFNKILGLVIKMSFMICYSHRIWAVFWRLRPPVLPQLQEVKGSQDWCQSPQGSRCPQCLLSPRHLALKLQVQILLSRIQVHMKSATANVKVRESVWIVDKHIYSNRLNCRLV